MSLSATGPAAGQVASPAIWADSGNMDCSRGVVVMEFHGPWSGGCTVRCTCTVVYYTLYFTKITPIMFDTIYF